MDEVLQLAPWSASQPDAPALLIPGGEPLTYAAVLRWAGPARDALHAAGLRAGQAAAVVMQPGAESILACLAITGESACAPLHPALTQDEYQVCLSRLGASILVIPGSADSPASAAARSLGIRVLRMTRGTGSTPGEFTPEAGNTGSAAGTARQTDAVLLMFTSSTSGNPKLAPVTRANLTARLAFDARALGLGRNDRYLSLMPLYHLHGLSAVLTQLAAGGSVVCAPGFDPGSFLSLWTEFRPTWFSAGVPLLEAVAAMGMAGRDCFAGAPPRFIRVTGGTPEPALLDALQASFSAPVLNGYGLTESGSTARATMARTKPGSVGTSVGTEIAIADTVGNILAPDQEGEILLRGPAVISGYLDDEEANRRAFRHGWFRTGDLGRLDAEGFLYITGRLKEIINRGGEKILPEEIDRVLASYPGVKEAAAFGVPHRTLGEDVAAAVAPRAGVVLSAAELRRHCAGRLAPFKIPRAFVFVEAIPRAASGKPKRAALASEYGTLEPATSAAASPVNDIERRLIQIWSRILANPRVTAHDDFIRLGGDSLSAAIMLTEADREFKTGGRLLTRSEFFEQPTVATLARIVLECGACGEAEGPERQGILAFQPRGERVPVFCFPGWRGREGGAATPYYLRNLANSLGQEQPFYVVSAAIPQTGAPVRPVEETARACVEAIRRVRPRGPYILAGHCLGAVVAFEAAQQLVSGGEQVCQLFLFDAGAPGYPKIAGQRTKYGAELHRMLREADAREAWRHAHSLGRLLAQRVAGGLRRGAARFGWNSLLSTQVLNDRKGIALWEYLPRPCSVPMVHFIAADQIMSRVLEDPRYGWRDVAAGGIEFRSVAGDHHTMFSAGNAAELGGQMRSCLAAGVGATVAAKA